MVIESIEMGALVAGQIDYIFFVAGFALMVAMGECLVLAADKSERPGWIWMAGFLTLQAFALFGNTAGPAFRVVAAQRDATAALNAASFAFLLAFALRPPGSPRPRTAARVAALAMTFGLAAVGGIFGARALDIAAWSLGAPVAVFAAAAILPRIRARGPGWRAIAAFAACLALIGLLAAAAGLASILRPRGNPLVFQLIVVLLSMGLGVSLPAHGLAVVRANMAGLRKPSSRMVTIAMLSILPILVGLGWGITDFLEAQGRKLLKKEADIEARVYASIISAHTHEMDKIAMLLASSPAIAPFLASPDASLRAQVESALDRYSGAFDYTVCYVLDAAGVAVSSSNRRENDSFEGENYARRPYVVDALAGRQGQFFARGLTSGRRGYYASAPVRGRDGRVIGVAAIKQEVTHIESTLGDSELYFVTDPDGIVFMSARSELTLRSLWPVPDPDPRVLERSSQFGPVSVDPVLAREPRDGETAIMEEEGFIVAHRPLSPPGWSLVLLLPLKLVTLYRLAGILAALIVSTVVLGFSIAGKLTLLSSAQIAQSRKRYRGLVDTLPDWISIVDPTGICLFTNGAGLRALGRSPAEVAGRRIDEIWTDELVQLVAKGISEAYGNGRAFFETPIVGADGARRTWSFTVVPLAEGAERGEIMLIGADVTDSRAAAERLVRAERMAALGSLAAGVAHQFNNINTVAMGYLQILQGAEAGISDRSRQYLASARDAIGRAVSITSRLLALTSSPGAAGQSSIGDAARSIARTIGPELEAEGVSLTLDLSDELPFALERRHVDFLLRELLSNGRHALIDATRKDLRIETGQTGEWAFLRVSDTGIGIARDELRRIFTPFHSLKGEHAPAGSPQAKAKGVGLSLAIADSIVKGRGGRIEVESRPGEGSVFTVWLPCEAEKS
jgi:two-component system C4-dicarboxylate transport sensor histidine kinase DctB